jgi:tetratricopeptide (TPR) repeat protein
VVHRDLKPGNILVTPDGQVKLLDFGTSKLVDAEVNTTVAPSLSPGYASPEQLQGLPVTTASDVYSLGVILFELLAGQSPFGANGSWAMALWRATTSPAIPRPSTVSGDLWSIIAKSLEADPVARYQGPREMAADLQRYLGGHAVLARHAGFWYRAGKFVRRNRIAAAAAAALLVAVAVGVATTLWQARKAQNRFNDLRQYARYVVTDLHTGIQRLPGSTELQRQSVERSLQYLDQLSAESDGDDTLTLELADAYRRLADALGNPYRPNLGNRARAEAAYEKALALASSVAKSPAASRIAAETKIQLAGTAGFGGGKAAGLSEIRQSAATLQSLALANPADAELSLSAAMAFEVLGKRIAAGGGTIETAGYEEAATAYRQSAGIAAGILTRQPSHQGAIRLLAQCEMSQAILLGSDNPVVALTHHTKALQWLDRLPPSAIDADTLRFRATVLSNIGWAEGQAGKHADAIGHLEKAASILNSWTALDPANTNALYTLTGIYRALGIVEEYRKGVSASVGHFERAAALHGRLLEKDPANTVYSYLRAELLVRAGSGYADLGQPGKARSSAREGLRMMRKLADSPDPSASHLFGACRWFTETKVREERDPLAATKFCRMAEAATKGQDPDAYSGLAKALALQGDRRGAIEAMQRALAMIPQTPPGAAASRQRTEIELELARLRSSGR